MMKLLVFVALLATTVAADADPVYIVVAPEILRPDSDYQVSLLVSNTTVQSNLTVELINSANETIQSYFTNLEPNQSELLTIRVEDLPKDNYSLAVEGFSGDYKIQDRTSLIYEGKPLSILIQTDKSVYKPAQLVQFRVIVVDRNLRPKQETLVDIAIKDPQDNLIKEWKNQSLYSGVFSGSLPLTADTPLGEWKVEVQIDREKKSKSFTVDEYVLPTFSVDISLPPYVTHNRSHVVATVKATYTFGQPVKGDVILTVKSDSHIKTTQKFRTKMRLSKSGTADIPVDIMRDTGLTFYRYKRFIAFHAVVIEEFTGKNYSAKATIPMFNEEVKVELIRPKKTFHPGLPYTIFVKASYQDETPVSDDGPPVTIEIKYSDNSWNETVQVVPKMGLAQVDLYPPALKTSASMAIIVEARYLDLSPVHTRIRNQNSQSNSYLQISAEGDSAKGQKTARVGDTKTLVLNGTEPLTDLVVIALSKGDIVQVLGKVNSNESEAKLTVDITSKMAPQTHIIAYYVRAENQELLADMFSISIEEPLQTSVVLSSDAEISKPGKTTQVTIKTKPDSYVGLLGVDQSVKLYKTGNDISREEIVKELQSYDGGSFSSFTHPYLPFYYFGPSAPTPLTILQNAGLKVLSNTLLEADRILLYPEAYVPYAMPPGAPTALMSAPVYLRRSGIQPAVAKQHKKPIKVRKNFPETWIWTNVTSGPDGVATYSATIPDTITSWHISAFAINSETGLGVADDILKIKVFRPFFIKLTLPYSIIRGESVAIKAIVFNYNNKPITAQVSMDNSDDEFEFTNARNDISEETEAKHEQMTVNIEEMDGSPVVFVITPKKLGYISIKLTARAGQYGDAVIKKLLVKPEGQPQYFNQAVLISMDGEQERVKRNVSIDIPVNAVPGSSKISVSGVSHILGTTLSHIDDLVRKPYGCGEQNMINLVPNILVLNYLDTVRHENPELKERAIRHIESGYQRELTYHRQDGSFSAFGERDKNGSTWLTAFVVKTFKEAEKYISVDSAVIAKSVSYLILHQSPDGRFVERGKLIDLRMQGGSGEDSSALTSYVLIALSGLKPNDDSDIRDAANFVWERVSQSDNPYEVAIGTYALHLVDHKHKDSAFEKLLALQKQNKNGLSYWAEGDDEEKDEAGNQWYPNPHDVEMTSYALMTLVKRSQIEPALPVLRWLITKQNSHGGFSSTQDTVIGLQALAAIGKHISGGELDMSVSVTGENLDLPDQLHFETGSLLFQKINIEPADQKWLQIETSGKGTAVIQVSFQYNLDTTPSNSNFYLILNDTSPSSKLMQMEICTRTKEMNDTNMAVLEVELPSGFTADKEMVESLRSERVKRVDVEDQSVHYYFDQITDEDTCVTVPAFQEHKVTNHKPVPVSIYDYYNPSVNSRAFYLPSTGTAD